MNDMHMIRPSARYTLVRMAGTFLVVDSLYALIIVLLSFLNVYSDFPTIAVVALLSLHTLKFIVLVFLLADIVIRFLSVRYYVTKHHLVVGSGIVQNDEETYELGQIRHISVYQDWLGKRLNYGSIHLEFTAPGFDKKVHLVNVANPRGGAEEIEKFLGTEVLTSHSGAK